MLENLPEVNSIKFLKNVNSKRDSLHPEGIIWTGSDHYTELDIKEYQAAQVVVLRVDYDRDFEGIVLIRVRRQGEQDSFIQEHETKHAIRSNFWVYQVYNIPLKDPGVYEFDIFVNGVFRHSKALSLTA